MGFGFAPMGHVGYGQARARARYEGCVPARAHFTSCVLRLVKAAVCPLSLGTDRRFSSFTPLCPIHWHYSTVTVRRVTRALRVLVSYCTPHHTGARSSTVPAVPVHFYESESALVSFFMFSSSRPQKTFSSAILMGVIEGESGKE